MFLILSEELSYYLWALKQKVNTVQNKNLKYKEHILPIVIFRLLKSDSLLIISSYPQVITTFLIFQKSRRHCHKKIFHSSAAEQKQAAPTTTLTPGNTKSRGNLLSDKGKLRSYCLHVSSTVRFLITLTSGQLKARYMLVHLGKQNEERNRRDAAWLKIL